MRQRSESWREDPGKGPEGWRVDPGQRIEGIEPTICLLTALTVQYRLHETVTSRHVRQDTPFCSTRSSVATNANTEATNSYAISAMPRFTDSLLQHA